MKKILFCFILIMFNATFIIAQDKIAVFVYSTVKLDEPIDALRSNIEKALVNDSKYTVVDRNDNFRAILNEEFNYQGQGYVSDKQLVTVGEQLGANKVCGVVIVKYERDGYFIECKILDVKGNTIEYKADYPDGNERIHDLGITTSKKVAVSLLSQLDLLTKEQKDKARQEQQEKAREQKDKARQVRQEKARNERRERWEGFKNYIKTEDAFNFRNISCFNSCGWFGMGIYSSKKIFVIGGDFTFARLGAPISDLGEDYSKHNFENEGLTQSNYTTPREFLGTMINLTTKMDGGKSINEYICPRFQVAILPGIRLKNISIECGIGVYGAKDIVVTIDPNIGKEGDYSYDYYYRNDDSYARINKTTKMIPFFRPSISFWLFNGLTVTAGYNICKDVKELCSPIFSIGFFVPTSKQ